MWEHTAKAPQMEAPAYLESLPRELLLFNTTRRAARARAPPPISHDLEISTADRTHARIGPDTQLAQAHNHTQCVPSTGRTPQSHGRRRGRHNLRGSTCYIGVFYILDTTCYSDTTCYTEAFSISIELGLHGHGHSRFAVLIGMFSTRSKRHSDRIIESRSAVSIHDS